MAKFTENGFHLEYPDEWELEYSEENLEALAEVFWDRDLRLFTVSRLLC